MNTYTCSVPLLEESTMSVGTESVGVGERSEFKVTGLNGLEGKKPAILLVQHKRRPQGNVHLDTRSRIFGGDDGSNESTTGRVLKQVQVKETASLGMKEVLGGSSDNGSKSVVDGNKSVVDGNKSVVDGNKSVVDGSKSVVDGNKRQGEGKQVAGRKQLADGEESAESGTAAAGSSQVADNGPNRHVRGQGSRNPITQSGPGWTSNEHLKVKKRFVDRNAHQKWDILGTPLRTQLRPGVRNENLRNDQ